MFRVIYHIETNERVGFMSGLRWGRNHAINFNLCFRQWYGPPEYENIVFRTLHRQIQLTRDFPQHLEIQKFYFVVWLLSLFGLTFMIVGVFALTQIFASIGFLFILTTFLMRFLYCLGHCGNQRLINKIRQSVYQSNLTLCKYGFQVRFARFLRKWCFCIKCCCCCYQGQDMSTIEIFDINSRRKGATNYCLQQQLPSVTRAKTENCQVQIAMLQKY